VGLGGAVPADDRGVVAGHPDLLGPAQVRGGHLLQADYVTT